MLFVGPGNQVSTSCCFPIGCSCARQHESNAVLVSRMSRLSAAVDDAEVCQCPSTNANAVLDPREIHERQVVHVHREKPTAQVAEERPVVGLISCLSLFNCKLSLILTWNCLSSFLAVTTTHMMRTQRYRAPTCLEGISSSCSVVMIADQLKSFRQ